LISQSRGLGDVYKRQYKGIADANQVFFGFGRTWNFSLNYNF
jgi:hypothetical protein